MEANKACGVMWRAVAQAPKTHVTKTYTVAAANGTKAAQAPVVAEDRARMASASPVNHLGQMVVLKSSERLVVWLALRWERRLAASAGVW
jgi:hypothetical protein